MMKWKDPPAEAKAPKAQLTFEALDLCGAAETIVWTIRRPPILFRWEAYRAIVDHLSSDIGELGGLLVGRTTPLPYRTRHGYDHLTGIDKPVPSLEFINSGCSLEMGTEVWSRAAEEMKRGYRVVGWYHSHPGLGAFFSPRDLSTQAAFFGHGYSVGIVIDPLRGDKKCFAGPRGMEIDMPWPDNISPSTYMEMFRGLTGCL